MAIEKVKEFFRQHGMEEKVLEFETSSATVELAAQALHCEPCRIAKTLSFMGKEGPLLVVAAGDAKIDNPKFKAQFATKPKMLTPEQNVELIGHAIGGVCPFAVNDGGKRKYAERSAGDGGTGKVFVVRCVGKRMQGMAVDMSA